MLAPSRLSLASGVADSIRQAIVLGEFEEFLPNVRSLSKDLRVSVPTVLAAVKMLADDGQVEVRHGRPTRILSTYAHNTPTEISSTRRVVILGFPPEEVEKSPFHNELSENLVRSGFQVERRQLNKKVWGLTDREFERLIKDTRADCWVLAGAPQEVHARFAERNLPCLVGGGETLNGLSLPDFEMDFAATYRHAAHQLLNLGHRRICLLIGERGAKKNPASIEAYLETVRLKAPEATRSSLVRVHDGSVSSFVSVMQSLFAGPDRPTALIVAWVSRFVLAHTWLLSAGFRVPQDVSMISRDSDEVLPYVFPTPAHYVYGEKQAIRALQRAIIAIAEGKPPKRHTLIVPEYVKGDSLAPPPTA